jgi:type IV pilus biogenesis protein CpaD/CtpE
MNPSPARSKLALAVALTVAGCATSPRPTEARVAASEAAIQRAVDVGADRVPDAAIHLGLAEQQLADARRCLDDGEDDRASWLLVRADADAHLAQALAHEAETRKAAEEIAARVRDLAGTRHATAGDAQ